MVLSAGVRSRVYEGKSLEGKGFAVCPLRDGVDMGWELGPLEARIAGVEKILKDLAPFNLNRVRRSMNGKPVFLEYRYEFMPTLRDFSTILLKKKSTTECYLNLFSEVSPHSIGKVNPTTKSEETMSTSIRQRKMSGRHGLARNFRPAAISPARPVP